MNVDMNKVKAEMAEHWDMTAEVFDAHTQGETHDTTEGWVEMVFTNKRGATRFYIEVNEKSEVWHFDWVH